MFRSSHFDRVREMFANQFEADGDGFLFRKNSRGAAVRVTSAERDRFIAAFNRALSWMSWGTMGGTLVLILAVVGWNLTMQQDAIEPPLYVGMGVLLAISMTGWYRAWAAPARALATRLTTAPALSREEARRAALKRITWPQLGGAAASFAIGMFYLSGKVDLLSGWNRLWLALGALLFAVLAYRAFQKWRFDQTDRID